MSLFWLLCGALGLVLAFTGLPVWSKPTLGGRLDPYIGGPGIADLPATRAVMRVLPRPAGDLKDRLRTAGLHLDVEGFRLQQLAWGSFGLISGLLVVLLLGAAGAPMHGSSVAALMAIGAVFGYLARDRYLTSQVRVQTEQMLDELPTAIDLLTLALMSGHSVPAACARIGETMPGLVGDAFRGVVADVRSGSTTAEAIEGLSRRMPHAAAARLVDALCIALEQGAPLAEVLRSQADDLREANLRQLLELGGRREVLMLIPVVFLIMPVVVAFALLPGLVSLRLLVP